MASATASARDALLDIKAAVQSISLCSDNTVQQLKCVLGQKDNPDSVQKKNTAESAQQSLKKPSTPSATRRNKVQKATSQAKIVEIYEDRNPTLSQKQRLGLATDVVNSALQTLGDAVKSQNDSPIVTQISPKKPKSEETLKPKSRSNGAGVTKSSRRIREVSSNHASTSPDEAIASYKTPVQSRGNETRVAGLEAVVECARMAFEHLRRAYPVAETSADPAEWHIEHGMIAFVRKLVGLRFGNTAAKELKCLKRRLELCFKQSASVAPPDAHGARPATAASGVPQRETLATLLRFDEIAHLSDPAIHLLVTFQILVLRVIAISSRPHAVESLKEYIDPELSHSPLTLIQRYSRRSANSERAGILLEQFSQALLSLCPKLSSSNDKDSMDLSKSATPSACFLLQSLAFRARRAWMVLSAHSGSIEEEVFHPYSKCVAALLRRSSTTQDSYWSIKAGLELFLKDPADTRTDNLEVATFKSESLRNIYLQISELAQEVSLFDEAQHWLAGHLHTDSHSRTRSVEDCTLACKIATLSLTKAVQTKCAVDVGMLQRPLALLKSCLDSPPGFVDQLLYAIFDLRTSAVQFIKATSLNSEAIKDVATQAAQASCRDIVTACVSCQAALCKAMLTELFHSDVLEAQTRTQLIFKSAKPSIEAVIFVYLNMSDFDAVTWRSADRAFRLCTDFVQVLVDCVSRAVDARSTSGVDSSTLLVSLSNAHFRLHAKTRIALPDLSLSCLNSSCEMLLRASPEEKSDSSLIIKLDRLAKSLQGIGKHNEAGKIHLDLVKTWCEIRRTDNRSKPLDSASLSMNLNNEPQLSLVQESLRCLLDLETKNRVGMPHSRLFFDDENLNHDDRGVLLELQLGLLFESKSPKSRLGRSLEMAAALTAALYEIYREPTHHIQRKRLSLKVLDYVNDNPDCLPVSLLRMAEQSATSEYDGIHHSSSTALNTPLQLTLALAAALVLRCLPNSENRLQSALSEWTRMVEESKSWSEFTGIVGECDQMLERLSSLSEFLGSRGHPYLQLSTLRLVFKLHERRRDVDERGFFKASVAFGLQLLRLGYSELAGTYFVKAQTQMEYLAPCLEDRIDYHLVYAEYFLEIEDQAQCLKNLDTAHKLFDELESFVATKSGASPRLAKVVNIGRNADLLHLRSRLFFETGSFLQSLWFAKLEVALLQGAWKSLGIREKASRQNKKLAEGEGEDLIDAFSHLNVSSQGRDLPNNDPATLYGHLFWPLVPRLCKALVHLSGIYQCSGLLNDATHQLDQALQLAEGTASDHSLASILIQKGECGCRAGSAETSWEHLDRASKVFGDSLQVKDAAILQQSIGRFHHLQGQLMTEIDAYNLAESILAKLIQPDFVRLLEGKSSRLNSCGANKTLQQPQALLPESQGRKRTDRSRPQPRAGRKAKASPYRSSTAQAQRPLQFSSFSKLHNDLIRLKAESLLLQGNLDASAKLVSDLLDICNKCGFKVEQRICQCRQLLSEAIKILSGDGIFSMIAESAISFPGAAVQPRKSHHAEAALRDPVKQEQRLHKTSPSRSQVQVQSNTVSNFRQLLGQTLQRLSMNRSVMDQLCTISVLRQASSVTATASMMLSSVGPVAQDQLLHPSFVGYSTDIPQSIASLRDQAATYVDKAQKQILRGGKWFRDSAPIDTLRLPEMSQFREQFVDCLPASWTAVSLSLDESQTHLHLTRYRAKQCALVLRLPLTRQNAEDPDEESFAFSEAKAELTQIVELSDATVCAAKEDPDAMKKKSAKAQWWAKREALDHRLHDFLLNVENMWLGGFRGIFSQHKHNPQLLARFQQSFETILDKHLPSRQSSRKRDNSSCVKLDPQVLDLFVGLVSSLEDVDSLDEILTDILYFVVDILQFNGETNAYDEIDFDSIIVETQDALRSYHEASLSEPPQTTPSHTILVLDKQLHAIPWESLPCLAGCSVSRVYSLIELQERLAIMQQQISTSHQQRGVHASIMNGTYILNPSGDLSKTQDRFEKQLSRLSQLSHGWTAIINRDPTESEFATALHSSHEFGARPNGAHQATHNRILLYFGHGSGTQYIRHRRIKQLRFQHQEPSHHSSPRTMTPSPDVSDAEMDHESSAVDSIKDSPQTNNTLDLPNSDVSAALLFGCSSASLRQNLEFEPHGTPKSYMLAGAPALLGSLWDVTDGDVDKFAAGVLERWGLFDRGTFAEMRKEGSKGRSRGGTGAKRSKETGTGGLETRVVDSEQDSSDGLAMSLTEAAAKSRGDCYLKYLNGAAMVVYGVPVYLSET